MPIDRAPWNALVDDDGSNLVGTVWNKDKIKTVILDPTDAALAVAWVDVPYNAANFTGNASAWTVTADNLKHQKYLIHGKAVDVMLQIEAASTAAGNTALNIFGWPLTFAASPPAIGTSSQAGAGWGPVQVASAGSGLSINRYDFGAFPASTGGSYLFLTARFRLP